MTRSFDESTLVFCIFFFNFSNFRNRIFIFNSSADLEILTRKFGVLGIGGLCEPQREIKVSFCSLFTFSEFHLKLNKT